VREHVETYFHEIRQLLLLRSSQLFLMIDLRRGYKSCCMQLVDEQDLMAPPIIRLENVSVSTMTDSLWIVSNEMWLPFAYLRSVRNSQSTLNDFCCDTMVYRSVVVGVQRKIYDLRDVPRENQKISHFEKHGGQPISDLTPWEVRPWCTIYESKILRSKDLPIVTSVGSASDTLIKTSKNCRKLNFHPWWLFSSILILQWKKTEIFRAWNFVFFQYFDQMPRSEIDCQKNVYIIL
jgi:hypothetical protein